MAHTTTSTPPRRSSATTLVPVARAAGKNEDHAAVLALLAGAFLLGILAMTAPTLLPYAGLGVVLLAGAATLGVTGMAYLTVAVASMLAAFVVRDLPARGPGLAAVVAAGFLAAFLHHARRPEFEAVVAREAALAEARDQVAARGELRLPTGWRAEVALHDPEDTAFARDYLLVAPPDGTGRIEAVLVVVAGDGRAGAGRALLLAGALNALLGTVSYPALLPAANAHLVRQGWPRGVASAAHVVLDPDSGRYWLSTAGQAPHAQFLAGSGRWSVPAVPGGSLLGVPNATYPVAEGRLTHGDALLLYTGRGAQGGAAVGLDRLLGEAERLVPRGFRGGVQALAERLGGEAEDRVLALLWRE